jgi:Fe-S-cluster-containing dehydrogenase component/DMSO reductase anchor subunit
MSGATAPDHDLSHTRTLIDELLDEQRRLQTPVAVFSETCAHEPSATGYRELIPLSAPKPGEQYAFQVDLDACSGCKACVSACHSLNGLDDNETWRDVGLIHGGTTRAPYQQTITTACHHCADPACLNGCPVLAYEKDPVTGIVRHLDDQCIGCQYCVLKCPYDVPKYNERLGIVRKCDMCHSRLAVGEAPACAQACPTHAIRIVTILTEDAGTDFLLAAPAPDYTRPTTSYESVRALPENVAAADASILRPQPPHWPLVIMLTLLPMAVGLSVAARFAETQFPKLNLASLVAGSLGLGASVFHLGKPLRAWRVFLGLRTSWLSREAVIFGNWFGLAISLEAARNFLPQLLAAHPLATTSFAWAVTATGIIGLFCSVMIYVDTRREFWRLASTGPRFIGTAAIFGALALFVVAPNWSHAAMLGGIALFKLALETRVFRILDEDGDAPTPARKTALLLSGPLRTATAFRYLLTAFGALALPLCSASGFLNSTSVWFCSGMVLAGEIAERFLFFRAVVAPKMPGVPTS